jgi:nucleotide-binding universal stress UspA family protein
MFKHVLVPLDGSALAESVLPTAVSLASTLHSAITLFHVIERNAPEEVHKDRHLTSSEEADVYLQAIARRDFVGLMVDWHVHADEVKDVASSIAAHAEEHKSDLILMCAHGHGGMRAVLFGSIAQRVIARGETPVLLLRPDGSPHIGKLAFHKIILPLDSKSVHDIVFHYAKSLALANESEIAMLSVIPTLSTLKGEQAAASSLLPGTTTALLDIEEQATREHLLMHVEELQKAGFIATAAIVRGDPAVEIISAAERWNADLMVLATHRKAGMDAFWAGSLAPEIARKTKLPLLLIPLK